MQQPNLILLPHPATTEGRELEYQEIQAGESLRDFLYRLEILPADPAAWAVSVNSQWVAPESWPTHALKSSDLIEMRAVARDDSTMRMAGMLAIAVAAAYTGGAAAAAFGGYATAAGAAAGVAASAAITIGGGLILNQVLPVTQEQQGKYANDTASTTYSLSASNNSSRPWGPMALVIGKHKIKPDFASKPYTEQAGDKLYLLQAFHFGLQPDLEIEQVLLGDTPIGSYEGVQVEVSGPDGKLKLIAGNVDTQEGRAIKEEDGWVVRTTSPGTTRIIVDLLLQAYHINDSGGTEGTKVDIEIDYRPVGEQEWKPFSVGSKEQFAEKYWSLGRWDDVREGAGGNDGGDNGGWDNSSGGDTAGLGGDTSSIG